MKQTTNSSAILTYLNIFKKNKKPDKIIKDAIECIAEIFNVELAGYLLYEPQTEELVAQKNSYGIPDKSLIDKYRVPTVFDTIIRDIFTEKTPYYMSNDPYSDPRTLKSLLDMFKVRNVMTLPIKCSGKMLGLFQLANKLSGDFTDEEVRLALSLTNPLALLLNNIYLKKEENVRLRELELLLKSSKAFGSAKTYNEVLKIVAEQANIISDSKFASVLLINRKYNNLEIVAGHNLSETYIKSLNQNIKINIGEGSSGLSVLRKKPVVIEDIHKSKIYEKWRIVAEAEGYKAVTSLPLIFQNKPIGAISLYFSTVKKLSKDEINLLMTMVNDAAMAIEHARIADQEKRVENQLKAIRESSISLLTSRKTEDVLELVAKTITKILNFERSIIFLFNRQTKSIAPKYGYGLDFSKVNDVKIPLYQPDSPFNDVFWQLKSLIINEDSPYFNYYKNLSKKGHGQQILISPIISRLNINPSSLNSIVCNYFHKNTNNCWTKLYAEYKKSNLDFNDAANICINCNKFKIQGAIAVDNAITDKFIFPEDLTLLNIYAHNVSQAIDNATLIENLEYLSITDPLTNLYNRSYFQQILKKEITRAKRYGENLSLLFIDLDNFKEYNDKLGHVKGDVILKMVADIIKSSVRKIDVPCRYGGDEFVVILPHTGRNKAQQFSKRLKNLIMNSTFRNKLLKSNVKLTASTGISTFPTSANTIDDLIIQADNELLKEKRKRSKK